MKIVILDGYVDEPSCLGVPPYISPYPRSAAGAALSAGAAVEYLTIGQVRAGKAPPKGDLLVAIGGSAVPGKYLRDAPASKRELISIAGKAGSPAFLGGPMAAHFADEELRGAFDSLVTKDIDATVFEFARSGRAVDRRRSLEEFDQWSLLGATICKKHPDLGGPLIAEIQTYRGCVRHHTGGCSFCIEPGYGEVEFRNPDSIIAEAEALSKAGVKHLRIGGQSCFVSYMAEGVGKSETPRPSPGMIGYLLKGVREAADPKVLHLDNANPAVIAEHPDESGRIMELIADNCTSGNVLALGMESADPRVKAENNLNATPEQVFKAIEIINRAGKEVGPTGLPKVLPGLNFLFGLRGETKGTYEADRKFLSDAAGSGLFLRRINIRQVIPSRSGFRAQEIDRSSFVKFKSWVREEIDRPMLERTVPYGTVLRDVYLELRQGNVTFGRQVGSYPILVGMPYKSPLDRFVDVMITGHGFRSVTGVEHPLDINKVPMSALSSIPKIGAKRARRIVLARPITDGKKLREALDSDEAFEEISRFVRLPRERIS
jgi:radical SAM superfamily enzyme with C-terminal helix-hairpin-helix motif